jgi:uncharacterized protein
MRIRIDHLQQSRLALEFEQPADRFPALRRVTANADGNFTGPVRASVTAERVGEMVEIRGQVRATARQCCGRCLAEFDAVVEADFELTYARRSEGPGGAPDLQRPDPAADDGIAYFHGDEIDLTAGVQEHLILALPLRPLCRDSCKGLCVRCGADLNAGPCGCADAADNGPFAALKRLKGPDIA